MLSEEVCVSLSMCVCGCSSPGRDGHFVLSRASHQSQWHGESESQKEGGKERQDGNNLPAIEQGLNYK